MKHLPHLLLVAIITVMVATVNILCWMVYSAFKGINQDPIITPLSFVSPAYADEIPKEQTRWYRLYTRVRRLESSNGTKGLAVTCKKKGKVNEIGYLPVKGYCFPSREAQELEFARWISNHITVQGMSEDKALLHYSAGAYQSK